MVRFKQMCVVTKGKGAQEATTAMIDLLCMGPLKNTMLHAGAWTKEQEQSTHVTTYVSFLNPGSKSRNTAVSKRKTGMRGLDTKKDTKHIENDDKVSPGQFD